jgi:hypothetical protein
MENDTGLQCEDGLPLTSSFARRAGRIPVNYGKVLKTELRRWTTEPASGEDGIRRAFGTRHLPKRFAVGDCATV